MRRIISCKIPSRACDDVVAASSVVPETSARARCKYIRKIRMLRPNQENQHTHTHTDTYLLTLDARACHAFSVSWAPGPIGFFFLFWEIKHLFFRENRCQPFARANAFIILILFNVSKVNNNYCVWLLMWAPERWPYGCANWMWMMHAAGCLREQNWNRSGLLFFDLVFFIGRYMKTIYNFIDFR